MTESVEQSNPLLAKMQKVVQGTKIRLPSKGLFYTNKELREDVIDGEIYITPMTTRDEIIIRTVAMLHDGTAVEQVITRCSPQVKKPADLFQKDVDYILAMLRKVSYGDNILIPFTCPNCVDNAPDEEKDKVETHDYPVSIDFFIKKSKQLEEEDLTRYKFTLTNGMVVNLRPSKFSELIKIQQLDNPNADGSTKSTDEIETMVIISISSVIKDVDGFTDNGHIQEWLKALHIKDMKEILAKISDSNDLGPDFNYKINCKDCNTEHDISYILNPVSFFTLPSSPETN